MLTELVPLGFFALQAKHPQTIGKTIFGGNCWADLKRVAKIPVDSYPVGLALSPDGKQVWVTSQGDGLKGGNSVGVYQVAYRLNEEISISRDPRRQQGESGNEK